jgi:hypothetical protein
VRTQLSSGYPGIWTVAGLLVGMGMFSGNAWADVFDYNVITPGNVITTGQPLGGFMAVALGPPGTQEWYLEIPGTAVPENSPSNLPCDGSGGTSTPLGPPPSCYNDEYYYSADGLYLGAAEGPASLEFPGVFGSGPFGGVVIDDSGGDPLAIMGSPQEFVSNGILRGFLDVLKSDIFGIGNGHAASLQ